MHTQLLDWLEALDAVEQDPRFHPEGDALTHSLQVFQRALDGTTDPTLHVAALLHDIGKAIALEDHAELGADLLEGHFSERVVALVRHHMDLLHQPRQTRARWAHSPWLRELELLRRFDLAGRVRGARVMCVEQAVEIVMEYVDEGVVTPLHGGWTATEDAR